jgi:hypothetical protein
MIEVNCVKYLRVARSSWTDREGPAVRFTTPFGHSVCKFVGSGRDVDIPVDQIGSATFTHDGLAESITADVNLSRESTLDLIAESGASTSRPYLFRRCARHVRLSRCVGEEY